MTCWIITQLFVAICFWCSSNFSTNTNIFLAGFEDQVPSAAQSSATAAQAPFHHQETKHIFLNAKTCCWLRVVIKTDLNLWLLVFFGKTPQCCFFFPFPSPEPLSFCVLRAASRAQGEEGLGEREGVAVLGVAEGCSRRWGRAACFLLVGLMQ